VWTATIGFHCYYRSTTFTTQNFKVITRILNGNIEQHTNWDYTSNLTFFEDETFTNIISPIDLRIGFEVYFRTTWDLQFVEDFPIQFYNHRCAIVSGENEYEIIKNGCGSVLTNTLLHSPNAYQPYFIDYSFR